MAYESLSRFVGSRTAFSSLLKLHILPLLGVGAEHEDVLPNLRTLQLNFYSAKLTPLNFLAGQNTIHGVTVYIVSAGAAEGYLRIQLPTHSSYINPS